MILNNIINRIKQINPNIKFIGEFNENNQRTGYWERYLSNGNIIFKGNYLNGLKHGYWENYWLNGKLLKKGNYINGKEDGYWEYYWFDGNLKSKCTYHNDEL